VSGALTRRLLVQDKDAEPSGDGDGMTVEDVKE